MTERDLLQAVRDLAKLRGWLVYHTHDSRRSEPGFPDLVMVHPRTGRLLVAELKSAKGRVTRDQAAWLDALSAVGVDARVWRPDDLAGGHVAQALAASSPTESSPVESMTGRVMWP